MWFRRRFRLPAPDGVALAEDSASAELVRYLERILPPAAATEATRTRLRQFQALSAARQDQQLPGLYLLIEQEIGGAASGGADKARAALRQTVASHFPPLLSLPGFALILAPTSRQELLLCRKVIAGTLEQAAALLGAAGNDFLRSLAAWVDAVPDASLPLPFNLGHTLPTRDSEWVTMFFRLARELYFYLEAKLGETCTRSFYERSYNEAADRYAALETFPVVVNLLPETLLDSEKIGKLSRSQVQKVLLQKLGELNEINGQLRIQYHEVDRVRRELVSARDELEQRVAERTAELSAANQQLLREVAERQRAEEELREARDTADLASRAKSEFLANMSHELRTPLNAIIGFAEIMRKGVLGPLPNPDYVAYAADIHSSGEHLLTLINEILEMARVEAGKVELREAEVDIAATVEAAVRLARPRAEESGIEVRMAGGDGLPPLYGDERLIRQALLHLLSNAVKFTPAGGTVTIETGLEQSGGLVVQIRDTGIGIAPGDVPKAFAPFGQVEATLSRKQGGTGLGLPLAKSFAELHGGSLALESRVGVGTTVSVRFPAERLLRAETPEPQPATTNVVALARPAAPR